MDNRKDGTPTIQVELPTTTRTISSSTNRDGNQEAVENMERKEMESMDKEKERKVRKERETTEKEKAKDDG